MECSRCNQTKNNCENMNQTRSNCENMNQTRNNCRSINQPRSNCRNMNYARNNYRNMNQNRNNGWNMNQNNSSCGKHEEKKACECQNSMDNKKVDEGCDRGNEPVDKMMPAMCYVPWQQWEDIYCMEKGFECGTIFGKLDKPFIGRSAK